MEQIPTETPVDATLDATTDTPVVPPRPELLVWRSDREFIADWFVVEMHLDQPDLDPTEKGVLVDILSPTLHLLRDPELSFHQLGPDLVHCVISSPDALITARVSVQDIVLDVHVLDDPAAAIRFVECINGYCAYGTTRVRTMPDGVAGEFEPMHTGYVFGRVTEDQRSKFQRIAIADHPITGRALLLEHEIQFGAIDEHIYSQTLVSHSMHPDVKNVLILGGGDCGVLREVLTNDVERVVMVELDQQVVDFCKEHFPAVVGRADEDPRTELRFEDAFVYLAECEERFDLVIWDLADEPIGDFSLSEQIELMSNLLAENGTVATHLEYTRLSDDYPPEPMLEAISDHFENVEVTSREIPSFADQRWLFVRATDRKPENARMGAAAANTTLGLHLVVEFNECDQAILDDTTAIAGVLSEAARCAGEEVVEQVFHQFRPTGVTGCLILASGHVTIHTWPDAGYASVDVYSSHDFDLDAAEAAVKNGLKAKHSEHLVVERPGGATELRLRGHRKVAAHTENCRADQLPAGITVQRSEIGGFGHFAARDFADGELIYTTPGRMIEWDADVVLETDLGSSFHDADSAGYELEAEFLKSWPASLKDAVAAQHNMKKRKSRVMLRNLTNDYEREVLFTGFDALKNHSHTPNTVMDWANATVEFETDEEGLAWPSFSIPTIAVGPISAGEELTVDYRVTLPEYEPPADWTR